jgi:alanine dehydrogenase
MIPGLRRRYLMQKDEDVTWTSLVQAFGAPPSRALVLDADRSGAAGCGLAIERLHEVLADAWSDIRAGLSRGAKSVLSLGEEEFWAQTGLLARPAAFSGERLGWKLSCLSATNPEFAGVKVIGANAFNRLRGLPRSNSTFILMEKFSMQPVAILDATRLSAARTGVYASTVLGLCPMARDRIDVFLFGAGPIADAVLQSLAHSASSRIARVFVRARRLDSARKLSASIPGSCPFDVIPVEDNRDLAEADFIVTATNSDHPLFSDEDVRADACFLHLGGDEVPEATLRRILRKGHLGCDDLSTVSRRGSQSLALMFSRQGSSLEALGTHLGIAELSKTADWAFEPGTPVSFTCVGLPMLDLYVAAALYRAHLAAV